jgi:uncharacterized protein (TIGR00725 family)
MTSVAVCGPGTASEEEDRLAEEVGRRLAEAGAVVLCGGLGGVMDAAARGAAQAGGTAVGILPGEDRLGASEHLSVAIPTGIGEARNAIIVRAADVVIAIGGEWGTLSEIALARKMGKPVVALRSWELGARGEGITQAHTPADAVDRALEQVG